MSAAIAPEGYPPVIPYMVLPNADGFFPLVQALFGAEEMMCIRREDQTIHHGEFRIGPSVIMYGQASEQWPATPASLFIYVADVDATYARALELGCVSLMPLSDQEYGRTCGIKDPHGNTWWPTTAKC